MIVILVLLMCVCISLSIGLGVYFYLESIKEKDVDAVWGEWETDVSCKGLYGGKYSQKRVCTPGTGKGKKCSEIDGGNSTRVLECKTKEVYDTEVAAAGRQKLENVAAEATRIQAEKNKLVQLQIQNLTDPNSMTQADLDKLASLTSTVTSNTVMTTQQTIDYTQKIMDDAEKLYNNIKANTGHITTISLGEAAYEYSIAIKLFIEASKLKNPTLDYTTLQTKANSLSNVYPVATVGTNIPGRPLVSYTCPDGSYLTEINGSHGPYINQIGIKCFTPNPIKIDGSISIPQSVRERFENVVHTVAMSGDSGTINESTSEFPHPTVQNFSFNRPSGFNTMNVNYSSDGILGMEIDGTKRGSYDSTGTKKTLGCGNGGKIKGIRASYGGGKYGILNEIGLVCEKGTVDGSQAIGITGKPYSELVSNLSAENNALTAAQKDCIKSGDWIYINNYGYQQGWGGDAKNYKILSQINGAFPRRLEWKTNGHDAYSRWWIRNKDGGCIKNGDKVWFEGLDNKHLEKNGDLLTYNEGAWVSNDKKYFTINIYKTNPTLQQKQNSSNTDMYLKPSNFFTLTQDTILSANGDTPYFGITEQAQNLQAFKDKTEIENKHNNIASIQSQQQQNCVIHGDTVRLIFDHENRPYALTRLGEHGYFYVDWRNDYDDKHKRWIIYKKDGTGCINQNDSIYLKSASATNRRLSFKTHPKIEAPEGETQTQNISNVTTSRFPIVGQTFIKYNQLSVMRLGFDQKYLGSNPGTRPSKERFEAEQVNSLNDARLFYIQKV